MTFSIFAKTLKTFYTKNVTNGSFVLDLIDESLEEVAEKDKELVLEKNCCISYNPIKSEETARKYFDGSRKISRQNFEIIEKHFERTKFMTFLKNCILNTDDNYRHLVLRFLENGIECDEDNIVDKCADIFDEIIANADKEYKKPSEIKVITDPEQIEFLDSVFIIIQKLINHENWPFHAPVYKAFKQELYELVEEDVDERFDISIENYNGENPEPALKCLLKCKKSNIPIAKDEVVLFQEKVRQVPGCCKAIFVTNNSFDEDAFSYAKKMGIGLLRIFDAERIKWFAPRTMEEHIEDLDYVKSDREIEHALLNQEYEILNNFVAGYYQECFANVSTFFNRLFGGNQFGISNVELYSKYNSLENSEVIPFLSEEKLQEIAQHIRTEMYGPEGMLIKDVKTQDLVDYIEKRFGFKIVFIDSYPPYTFPQKIRGLVDYPNKTIMIYGIDKSDRHLVKFTIAHEISHLILHANLFEKGKDSFSYFFEATKESKQMEIQANMLANYIILDGRLFKEEFIKLADRFYIKPRPDYYIYLDNQPCNRKMYSQIVDSLISIFDVSREQIKIRLLQLGWLKEVETKKSRDFFIGNIFE